MWQKNRDNQKTNNKSTSYSYDNSTNINDNRSTGTMDNLKSIFLYECGANNERFSIGLDFYYIGNGITISIKDNYAFHKLYLDVYINYRQIPNSDWNNSYMNQLEHNVYDSFYRLFKQACNIFVKRYSGHDNDYFEVNVSIR